MAETDLGHDLIFRPDEANPMHHGFIEPSHEMSLEEYRAALEATRDRWVIVVP
jgi:hypothetical protein